AIALDAGLPDAAPGRALPSDHAQGLREWPEAGVTQIALGPWRASVTINDIPSTAKRGGHPSGGSLAMLWHERAGPLLVASLNDYLRYEGVNMDEAHADTDKTVLTPRLEAHLDGCLYSSVHEGRAELASTQDGESIHLIAHGVLRDVHGQAPPDGSTAYELQYRFTPDAFVLTARCASPAVLHVPLVAPASASLVASDAGVFTLHLPEARVRLVASAAPVAPVAMSATERVFNYVPGVQAAPFRFDLTPDLAVEVRLEVSPHSDAA
ncbi:MAG: hypothetical protein H7067_07525, partial [Burkholderiales bacterium]|nr:hypothetical protein [Opitutaceae bacterium]